MAGVASILEVLIVGDATSLNTALAQASASTKQFQASQATASRSTSGLTSGFGKLGVAATIGYAAAATGAVLFAKASVDSALEYNRAFTQIDALTNATTEQIGVMNDTVMKLARETAQSPVELAHAMYFLASAGLDVQQQMSAIDAVAHGMAIGLGEGADLARITANALNVFGDNGLTAVGVMDTLVAAIREGTAEPDEFAGALGRVLPIADQAGISFAQVAASLASMSNAGLDVNEGVTSLRAILQSLVAPTAQTEAAFAKVGVTVDQVVDSMGEQGLIATLRMLSAAAKENTDSTGEYNQTMRHIIPNIRGLAGALNLTHQEAKKVNQIFQSVAAATGDAGRAFETTAQSDAFKMQQALNNISIDGQELATKVLPAIAAGLGFVADNATTLLGVLGGYAVLKVVSNALASVTAATVAAEAPTVALASEAGLAAVAIEAEGVAATTGAVQMELFSAASLGATSQQELFAASNYESAAAATVATEANVAAAGSQAALAASTGMATGAMKLFNAASVSAVIEIYAIVTAGQKALKMFKALHLGDIIKDALSFDFEKVAADFGDADWGSVINSITETLEKVPIFGTTLELPHFAESDELQNFQAQINQINLSLLTTGNTAKENVQIINEAMASVGGTVDPGNIDDFAAAVETSTAALLKEKEAADYVADASQKSREETDRWQHSLEELTGPLQQLTNIGLDVNGFLDDFKKSIQDADDPMAAFEEGLQKVKAAAADWRSEVSGQLTGIGDVLSTLDEKAHLSTTSIHNAFMDAAQDARDFANDLKVIGETGGQVGRNLASSLLEGGLSNLAGFIAGQSADTRRQLVSDYGAVLNAGDQGARTLQNVIAPVLRNIRELLLAIAQHFDPSITLHDGDTGKKLKDHKESLEDLTRHGWTPDLFLNPHDTKPKLDDIHNTLGVISGKPFYPEVYLKDHASKQLEGLQYQLNNISAKNYNVDVIVHTKGGSPMPDEALKMHLVDPMKRMGFKKIGDRWTLPLDVSAHTDTNALKQLKQLQELKPTTTIGASLQHAFNTGNGVSIVRAEIGQDKTQAILQDIKADAHETGKLHLKALRQIIADARNPQRARDWAEEAMAAFKTRMEQADTPPAWIATSGKNVPRLPRGVGRENFKRGGLTVKLDRKHYADSMTQEVSYGRGY